MSEDLPRAIVKRIVKAKMLEVAAVRFRDERTSRDLPVHKDAVLAFAESAKIFIHYLSATAFDICREPKRASDICKESKRQTLSAEDVLKALEETEFVEFLEPLRIALDGYRLENASKKADKKDNGKRRKKDKGADESHEDENGQMDDDDDNRDDQDEGSNEGEGDDEDESESMN